MKRLSSVSSTFKKPSFIRVNIVYIFHVLPQLQCQRMIKTKEISYFEALHSQDSLSVTY